MRITSKGQITIPQTIREKAGLHPQSSVEFSIEGNTVILRKVQNDRSRGNRLILHMRGKGSVRMSTDEIMALTRGR